MRVFVQPDRLITPLNDLEDKHDYRNGTRNLHNNLEERAIMEGE